MIRYWFFLTVAAFLIPTFGIYISYLWISENIIQFPMAFTVSMLFDTHLFFFILFLAGGMVFMGEFYLNVKKMETEVLMKYFKELIVENKQKIIQSIHDKYEEKFKNKTKTQILKMVKESFGFE